jgi:ubiquinone/menaquinone biosynthesis C-methylase UbiE
MKQEERPAQSYFLGADDSERARLLAQGEIHRAETEALFDRLEIPAGGRAIDFGCGPLGVLDLLSCRVGPTGEIVGLDSEPRMIDYAHRTIAERGLTNVRLIHADASASGLHTGSFDLAHERLVLVNLASPRRVVAEMVRVTRPGGWVVLQDVDWITWTCEPAHPAWNSLLDALVKAWRTLSLDPFTGRRIPAFLRDAGLVDTAIEARARTWRPGDPGQLLLLRFIDIFRSKIVEGGILDARQLARLAAELEEHLQEPGTFVMHPLLFQAWGRRPAGPSTMQLDGPPFKAARY